MNKIYIKPTTSVINAEPVCIMTGSNIVKGEEFDSGNGDEVLSRRGHKSVWDDDEEDEELY